MKSTQKITKAMKMVAAAKLRRAREAAENSRPYANRMNMILSNITASLGEQAAENKLLGGTGRKDKYLIIVASGERGLCGAFNSSIVKAARQRINVLQSQGKKISLYCVGKKAYEALHTTHADYIIKKYKDENTKILNFEKAGDIRDEVLEIFQEQNFDVCEILYNEFISVISQKPKFKRLIPLGPYEPEAENKKDSAGAVYNAVYEYEPDEEQILSELLPRNLATQIFAALLENAASEQGARMSAMDNATRNAGEMINKLTLVYNRTRQAQVTKELIEIISGAESL